MTERGLTTVPSGDAGSKEMPMTTDCRLLNRITSRVDILCAKPVIRDMRIAVECAHAMPTSFR